MFKINLLPKEVLERRRYVGWYPRVFLAAALLVLVVVGLYGYYAFEAQSKRNELQGIEEQSQKYSALADQLSIFQNKETQLQQREAIAQGALAGRVNVGQVANDISLVLPDEVWLDSMTIDEKTGLSISANTPRSAGESADVAYKSVAKTLVRLSELPELLDVWLGAAANVQWTKWAPAASAKPVVPESVNVVSFQATGKVSGATASAGGTVSGGGTSGATTSKIAPAAAAQGAVKAANSTNAGSSQ